MARDQDLLDRGVFHREETIPAALLRAYRHLARDLESTIESEWRAGIEAGTAAPTFFDVEDLSPAPPLEAFAASVDAGILGETFKETHRLINVRLRFVAPYPLAYLNWHRDHHDGPRVLIKCLIYLDDVPPDFGEFCYVAGSQLTLESESEEYLARRRGFLRLPGRAGAGIIFDTAGAHAPWPNRSDKVRQTLILTFARW